MAGDTFQDGYAYEAHIGRWSQPVAAAFLDWLGEPPGLQWLDAGCGTGELSRAALARGGAAAVVGIDPSDGFLAVAARRAGGDPRLAWQRGDVQNLPFPDGAFDVVVAGLVLNFVPDRRRMVSEMARVVRRHGTVALYVWDHGGQMQPLGHFWSAAAAVDPAAGEQDERRRFAGLCRPEPLRAMLTAAGLQGVATRAIDVPTVFADFADFWQPLVAGVAGPASSYCAAVGRDRRSDLRGMLERRLPQRDDGSIPLGARAWAVRGSKPS
ncbi:MAG TPA: class I SAM-dependent methyltransferase [Crenalkalicoccus sp.]|jgi:SAM-dependent methyltransferase|nr:class I SAM-dependent methyltransferase [Crenalkalicoccus sp.]